jgi:hypothetical protein
MANDVLPSPPSTKKRLASLALAIAAFSLLAYVVHRNGGIETIAGVVARLGQRWPLLLVPYGFMAFATIMAYRSCLPGRGRAVPFLVLVQIERSGTALNAFLPLGDSSGNIIKVALLRHWYTSAEIVAAGAWSNLAAGVGNALAAAGPMIAYAMGVLPLPYAALLSGICVAMTIPAATVMILVKRGLAVKAASLVTRAPFATVQKRKDAILAWAASLDHHVASAMSHRFRDFLHLIFWRTVYQVVRVGELWLVITLLELPGGLGAALAYNAMSRMVQQTLTFVPGRVGVIEGLAARLAKGFAWPAAAGVAFALTLRFAYVVNLVIASTALSGAHALASKYPPRSEAELRAARSDREGAS